MKHLFILAILFIFQGCQNEPSFQGIGKCSMNLEIQERTRKYDLKTCEIEVPIEWRYEKEMQGTSTVNKFIISSSEQKSLDEKANTIQNKSSILFLIESESIEHDFDTAFRFLKEDENTKVTEIIDTKFNNMNIKWVTYEDYSFIQDNLTCSSFTTFITPQNTFIGIIGQIIGEDLKGARMCHMIEIVKSLKLLIVTDCSERGKSH
ncbi:MAG: hypothetical protein AAF806_26180 [Bacteroidota bacterium]